MLFVSTRNKSPAVTLSAAIVQGLAVDGGLLVPAELPVVDVASLGQHTSYPEFAAELLVPFFAGDALQPHLQDICAHAFNFPIPLRLLRDDTYMLELFYGPTASFKDIGCRFLAECLNKLAMDHKKTVLVATSGDTGSAVAAALHQQANVNVIILYPYQKISQRQEHQITCWGDNVLALAVDGTFDDCQRIVKAAFKDKQWNDKFSLTTSNSINLARILPQTVYYAFASLQSHRNLNKQANFIVPSGNLGNVTACYWAKAMGFPIDQIVMATNANATVPDYLATGIYKARASVTTLANAMDVGDPSNMERLRYLFKTTEQLQQHASAFSVSNEQIAASIKDLYATEGVLMCPHTATACYARQQLQDRLWVVVATADPSKFETVLEPMLHIDIPPSAVLYALLQRQTTEHRVKADLHAVMQCALDQFNL